MKTLAALLAIATLTTAQCCHSVPCPEELGDCNKCIMSNGQVVALTRNICGDYTLEKCRNVYFGNDAGLSDDGCNTCTCGEKGAMCTLKGCPALVTVLTAVWGFLLESEPVLFFKLFDEL